MRFKIDWASLIVRRKFTVFSLFYFAIWGKFPSTRPRGGGIRSTNIEKSDVNDAPMSEV